MALVKRKRGEPKIIPNPFVVKDEWGEDVENILWGTEDELDQRIEDLLVGIARSFSCEVKAEGERSRDKINWQKLLRIYRNVWELSPQSIQDYLECSKSTSSMYCKAIKLANPFIIRLVEGKSGSDINGYVDATFRQIKQGYLRIL